MEWVIASISLQASIVVALTILLNSDLAAVREFLASLICSMLAEVDEERLPTSFDKRRTWYWAADTSGLDLGLVLVTLPSMTDLLEAAAQVERASLVDWRRMEAAEAEEQSDQGSLSLAKLSHTSS